MKKTFITFLFLTSFIFPQVGVYHVPQVDTFYLLPGEYWQTQFGVESSTPMLAVDAIVYSQELSLQMNYTSFSYSSSDSLNTWHVASYPSHWVLKWIPNYSTASTQTLWLGSLNGTSNIPINHTISFSIFGNAGYAGGIYDNFISHKFLSGINGVRGDVNRDGVIDVNDINLLLPYGNGHHWYFNLNKYTNIGVNMGLGSVLFSYPDLVSTSLINIWIHNPYDPMVQGLGIGDLFSSNRQVAKMPATFQQSGNTLIVQTQGNIVSVIGELNGQPWQKTYTSTNNIVVPSGLIIKAVDAVKVPNSVVTGIEGGIDNIQDFSLEQNYPNPFNPLTNINFSVADNSLVTLKVYDVLGKEVATLVNGMVPAGNYTVKFDGTDFVSGVYVYQLHVGKHIVTKKMLLIK